MRRQLQRHASLEPLRRRREHPVAPPRRVGVEEDIVHPAPPGSEIHLQPTPLAPHGAESHPLQLTIGHPQAAEIHPLGRETGAVEADKDIARTHARLPGQATQTHRQRRPQAAGQPRRGAEHRPTGLLRLRARIADSCRRAPHDGPPVAHIPHHRPHTAADGSQNSLCYLSHCRIGFLPYKIRAKSEKAENRPTKVPNFPTKAPNFPTPAPVGQTPEKRKNSELAPTAVGPSSELSRSCAGVVSSINERPGSFAKSFLQRTHRILRQEFPLNRKHCLHPPSLIPPNALRWAEGGEIEGSVTRSIKRKPLRGIGFRIHADKYLL